LAGEDDPGRSRRELQPAAATAGAASSTRP